jgi:hypothetical protein
MKVDRGMWTATPLIASALSSICGNPDCLAAGVGGYGLLQIGWLPEWTGRKTVTPEGNASEYRPVRDLAFVLVKMLPGNPANANLASPRCRNCL